MILIVSVLLILIISRDLKSSSHLEQAKYTSWWEINPTGKLVLNYEHDAANHHSLKLMKSKGIHKMMQDKLAISTVPPSVVDMLIPWSEYFFHTNSKSFSIPVK